MASDVRAFFMFEGDAEKALDLYASVFDGFRVVQIERYGEGEAGAGSVKLAVFALADREFMCIDSPMKHDFTFTPATSLFVDCESEAEIDQVFGKLAEGGKVMMPLDRYPFSEKFAWVADRFGVSWQLNLPASAAP